MKHWQNKGWKAILLLPLSCLFWLVAKTRKQLYQQGILNAKRSSVPVIVVGNISVGGTGKTPIVGLLSKILRERGCTPGIVSRGYGAKLNKEAVLLTDESVAANVGDEPMLLRRDTGSNVCVAVDRVKAITHLLSNSNTDVVISDDGLQHYAMQRNIEIAVMDAERGVGNGFALPSGPLREPVGRLLDVDLIAIQLSAQQSFPAHLSMLPGCGSLAMKKLPPVGGFHLSISHLLGLSDQSVHSLSEFSGTTVHAVAGLGYPQRYFDSLRAAGLNIVAHALPDHHHYTVSDIAFDDLKPVLITSKDAVKVQALKTDLSRVYEVAVHAVANKQLLLALENAVQSLTVKKNV